MLFKRTPKPEITLSREMNLCLSGEVIFKQHPRYLQDIKDQVSASTPVYVKTYLNTLYRVAELCQSLPNKSKEENYSLLKTQLELCLTTLRLRKGLLLPPNAGAETMAREEARWTYACFAASLLWHLSRIAQDRVITLYNSHGEEKGRWHPFTGSLFKRDFYFKVEFLSETALSEKVKYDHATLMNILSAHLIAPEIIHWLSQNNELFTLWREAVIYSDKDNVITALIQKAAEVTEFVFGDHFAAANVDTSGLSSNAKSTSSSKTHTSTLFQKLLDYLHEIEGSSNKENTLDYLRVPEGLFITQDTLQEFLINQKDIETALLKEDNNVYVTYSPANFEDRRTFKGILVRIDALDEKWQDYPINEKFQRELNEIIL